jgi:agmatinase
VKSAGDRALNAPSYYGTVFENTFAGARSFLRRRYLPDWDHLEGVDLAVLGIPFDLGTTNRAGARFGPEGIRRASSMMAFGCSPTLGVDPFDQLAVVDVGDVEIPVGDLHGSLKAIEEAARTIIGQGVTLISLGGDHLSSLALLRAQAARHGPVALVHFDAHTDVLPDEAINHGTVFYHALQEGLIDRTRTIQVGIRAHNTPADLKAWKALGFETWSAEEVHLSTPAAVAARIRERVGSGPAYLSFDIDGLDPSMAPGTGTPEPGGLFTWQARAIIQRLRGVNFVGMDVVEVAPDYDHSQITALAASALVADFIGLFAKLEEG